MVQEFHIFIEKLEAPPQEVKRALASTFHLPPKKAQRFLSELPRYLTRHPLEQSEAFRVKGQLEDSGLRVTLEPVKPSAETSWDNVTWSTWGVGRRKRPGAAAILERPKPSSRAALRTKLEPTPFDPPPPQEATSAGGLKEAKEANPLAPPRAFPAIRQRAQRQRRKLYEGLWLSSNARETILWGAVALGLSLAVSLLMTVLTA